MPEHGSRLCLRTRSTAPVPRATSPAFPGNRASRGRRLAAAASRHPHRAAPQPPPPAPSHTSGSSRSPFQRPAQRIFLPPSPQRLLVAAQIPWAQRSGGARRCPSLSRRQLPLPLHPHIPPPAAVAAAAAAPKFTALRRHEVILPAPFPGPPHSAPAVEGETAPSSRPPERCGALALPPPPEGPPLLPYYTHPAAREGCEGRRGPPAARRRVGGPSPGTAAGWAAPPPLQPSPHGSPPSAGGGVCDVPAQRPLSTAAPGGRHRGLAAQPSPAQPNPAVPG